MTAIRWLVSTIAVALCAAPGASFAGALVFTPPLDPAAHYPETARHEGVEGRAIVACTLGSAGDLTDCTLEVEEPQDYGFGAAAIAVVTAARLDIAASDAAAAIGRQIPIPVVFKLGSHPTPADTSPAS